MSTCCNIWINSDVIFGEQDNPKNGNSNKKGTQHFDLQRIACALDVSAARMPRTPTLPAERCVLIAPYVISDIVSMLSN